MRRILQTWLPAGGDAVDGSETSPSPGTNGIDRSEPAPAFDASVVEEFIQISGRTKVESLIGKLSEDYGDRLERLRRSADRHDFDVVRRDAHYLKGAFAQLGGVGASTHAEALERLAEAHDAEVIVDQVEACDRACRLTLSALEAAVAAR
jgi:HPt (histidine-containing phosphotransfer) domain-containing protein